METFEQEAELREEILPVTAEAFFARPLFRMPQFVLTTALGVIALLLDIRLDIAAWNGTKLQYDVCLWWSGCILVSAWFAITSHLEDVRAVYLNESCLPREQRTVLYTALLSDFRVALGGLTMLYSTAILLLIVIWRVLMGTRP